MAKTLPRALLCLGLLAPNLGRAADSKNTPAAAPVAEKTVAPQDAVPQPLPKSGVDYHADTPPPSLYDRQVGKENPGEEGVSLLGQVLRTIVSLALVVGLIYLLSKVGFARFIKARAAGGNELQLLERLPLDTRNSLFLVELSGRERFLVASGERGAQIVGPLSKDKGVNFAEKLETVNLPTSPSTKA